MQSTVAGASMGPQFLGHEGAGGVVVEAGQETGSRKQGPIVCHRGCSKVGRWSRGECG